MENCDFINLSSFSYGFYRMRNSFVCLVNKRWFNINKPRFIKNLKIIDFSEQTLLFFRTNYKIKSTHYLHFLVNNPYFKN